ncbi:MAG: M56 family metallopeptidase [Oscillospiraceae bacterium]|nr:M56 family metallopeptidase [Oscillospiraceae bacterium]
MTNLFITVLNMSLTGAFVIAAICLARLPLKKAPKIISYCLWAIAGFRLLIPFSIESMFSLIPFRAQIIPPDIIMQPLPQIDSNMIAFDNLINSSLPAAALGDSANPLQIWTAIGAWVWLAGAAIMFTYAMVSFAVIKRSMKKAVHVEDNIYEAGNIDSPFVLGFIKPMIYLPVNLYGNEKNYIILHEQTHIKRFDHLIKLFAYFILCMHWFNPLAWVAFILINVDMEMSCDERVLKEIGEKTKKDYSLLLLSLATKRRTINVSPLAFGESGVKERMKNILKYKEASRVVIAAAVCLLVIFSVGFSLDKVTATTAQILSDSDTTAEKPQTANNNPNEIPEQWFIGISGADMTVDDVLELAAKGDDLTAEDFLVFNGTNSRHLSQNDKNLVIFPVIGGHQLAVRAVVPGEIESVGFSCSRQLAREDGIECTEIRKSTFMSHVRRCASVVERLASQRKRSEFMSSTLYTSLYVFASEAATALLTADLERLSYYTESLAALDELGNVELTDISDEIEGLRMAWNFDKDSDKEFALIVSFEYMLDEKYEYVGMKIHPTGGVWEITTIWVVRR